ncbi:Choline/ethanolaminephosphotransferase 1 [Triplophysa tibetana]|uniref:Choline/ethanolaminephosphotransferase 1 n=1 Tax=Triplophysa tibetana TaxID=1572043 RepID=A0A5A9NVQ4_9TELE|nr:Choline/ethanolaminephosphotransferase 1 [Triplophysa tibetana]
MSSHRKPARSHTDSDSGSSSGRDSAAPGLEEGAGLFTKLMELPVSRLSRQQLRRLEDHQYSSEGQSVLEPFMQIYWCWLVSKVPLWMAPNLITIVGLATNIITTLILVYYCPTATEQAPTWAYLACALGLFIYQSLDAIDGKQARRTNSSTPLGELFDHGCDSLSTVFVILGTCISVQMGTHPDWIFFCCFAGIFMFYCAHWQTYVSGTLRFGIIDVTEVQIFIITMYLLAAIGGTAFWESVGTSVLSPSFHIGVVITLALMIYKKSSEQLFEKHPCLYVIAFGFVSAKLTNRLVVLSAFDLVRYCVSVCNQIATHLNICVFSIQPPSPSSLKPDSRNHH